MFLREKSFCHSLLVTVANTTCDDIWRGPGAEAEVALELLFVLQKTKTVLSHDELQIRYVPKVVL